MTIDELGNELRRDYDAAGSGLKMASLHLFGIKHARALETISAARAVAAAGLKDSLKTEVQKGATLAQFVTLK